MCLFIYKIWNIYPSSRSWQFPCSIVYRRITKPGALLGSVDSWPPGSLYRWTSTTSHYLLQTCFSLMNYCKFSLLGGISTSWCVILTFLVHCLEGPLGRGALWPPWLDDRWCYPMQTWSSLMNFCTSSLLARFAWWYKCILRYTNNKILHVDQTDEYLCFVSLELLYHVYWHRAPDVGKVDVHCPLPSLKFVSCPS